ncbi:MAG: hypothetical protein AUG74_11615 [Bacteroidetes bacterium 13_1_20CM_4_60_6]|nr:MAG: hypothetical protein AUG74_11615 [Bacteroidetes bacterium 13_1_20CM_4_60_6]
MQIILVLKIADLNTWLPPPWIISVAQVMMRSKAISLRTLVDQESLLEHFLMKLMKLTFRLIQKMNVRFVSMNTSAIILSQMLLMKIGGVLALARVT